MRISKEKLISILESGEAEGTKLDFKERPWDLSDPNGKGEFIKDLVAMANASGKGILGDDEGHIIIGVKEFPGVYRPVGVGPEDQTKSPLEERLQQIAESGIEPPLDFEYQVFPVVGYQVAVIAISGTRRPYCVATNCGQVREGQFYVRRGSTTVIASRDELKAWFHEPLVRENEDLRRQIESLESQIAKVRSEREPADWTLKHLKRLPSEYVRYIPCLLLERYEQGLLTVSTDEIVTELEGRYGISFDEMTKGLGIQVYTSNATKQNLDELIINVDPGRGLWRLNEKYVPLVRKFRDEVIEERGKVNWTLELFESVKAPTVRAIPCVFLENLEQTGSLTITTKELHKQLEKRLGKRLVKASFMGIWLRMQNRFGLKSLFIKQDRKTWRLNNDYLDLVKQFCNAK